VVKIKVRFTDDIVETVECGGIDFSEASPLMLLLNRKTEARIVGIINLAEIKYLTIEDDDDAISEPETESVHVQPAPGDS
jgi:hypothetical protein